MRKFTKALEEASRFLLETYSDFEIYGLGADYPNGLDGSIGGLPSEFPSRILDVPISESTVTGMALGRAISGKRTMVHHGRAEFAIFAADQIFTQAAKWRYQFGGQVDVELTIRVAMGRQWGNGPQHTASYLQFFSAVPGLMTFIPSSPNQAERLLRLAVETPNPVIFLEPRWLYQLSQTASSQVNGSADQPYDIIGAGQRVAIVTYGEGVLDSVQAVKEVESQDVCVFDLWNVTPGTPERLLADLLRFDSVIFHDPYCSNGGPLVDLAAAICQRESHPKVVLNRPPNVPVPTATSLTLNYYPNRSHIVTLLNEIFDSERVNPSDLSFEELHLPPRTQIGENWEIIGS